jgi:hypothetical protein
VLLCFGRFSVEHTRQVARWLEMSGQTVHVGSAAPACAWRQRRATAGRPGGPLDTLLPEGFLSRTQTKDRGAGGQVVLAHGAVAGFVTHCG